MSFVLLMFNDDCLDLLFICLYFEYVFLCWRVGIFFILVKFLIIWFLGLRILILFRVLIFCIVVIGIFNDFFILICGYKLNYLWGCCFKLFEIVVIEIGVFLFLWCCEFFVFDSVFLIKVEFEILCLVIVWEVISGLFEGFKVFLFVVVDFIFLMLVLFMVSFELF